MLIAAVLTYKHHTSASADYGCTVASGCCPQDEDCAAWDGGPLENWNNLEFQCFSDAQIAEYRALYQVSETDLELSGRIVLNGDGWGFSSVTAAIILREIFGFNVTLSWFYGTALKLMEKSHLFAAPYRVPFFHLEMWATDFEENLYAYSSPFVDVSLLEVPFSVLFVVKREVKEAVELEIGGNVTFLDFFRTWSMPQVIALMDRPSDIDVRDGTTCEDTLYGFSSCTNVSSAEIEQWTGGIGGVILNGTYYPPQCPPPADDCLVCAHPFSDLKCF